MNVLSAHSVLIQSESGFHGFRIFSILWREIQKGQTKKQVSYDIYHSSFPTKFNTIQYHSHSKTFSLLLCVQLAVNKCFLVTELSVYNRKLYILYQSLGIRTVWSLWSFRLKKVTLTRKTSVFKSCPYIERI